MAYFLKRVHKNGKTYLSICESFYHPEKKSTAHRTYKSLGSFESWKEKGIEDPIIHFQNEVDALNKAKKKVKTIKVSNKAPFLYLGYTPMKCIMDKLRIKKYIDCLKLTNDLKYDLFDLLSSLVYAANVNACSRLGTLHDELPNLFHPYEYSYDQLLDGLSFLGSNYEKFIEIFTVQAGKIFGIDTSKTYFTCTVFYFEIDNENNFKKIDPGEENKKSSMIELGLLLDSNLIPVGMIMCPGNELEKPILRDVIQKLKKKNNIAGRTVHVPDKGISCIKDITGKNGDGYLFTKHVKELSGKDKTWSLPDQGFKEVRDKKGRVLYYYKSCIDKFPYTIERNGKKATIHLAEKRLLTYNPKLASKKRYEINRLVEKAISLGLSQSRKNEFGKAGKYVKFTDGDGMKTIVSINREAIDKDLALAGYNLLVTSEIDMTEQDIYDTFNTIRRIEESFKTMKSDLDACPVFLHNEDAIKGHFLICYLAMLLERLFQFKVLQNKYSSSEVFNFIKQFTVVKGESRYINTIKYSDFIDDMSKMFDLPLTDYFLTERQINSIINYKL